MRALAIITLLFAYFLPPAALAADAGACRLGDVSRVYGDVRIVRNGTTVVPAAGEAFCTRDRVVTGDRGVAELKFPDGSEITVGKDSEFVIQRWKQRRLFANEASFELLKGAFRALTGTMTERRHRFEVKTTIATIGVRGTEFWGGMNLAPDSLEVIMLNGKGVYVQNDAGTVEITRPGTGVSVKAGGTPSEPAPWAPEKVKRAVGTITP